MDDMNEPKLKEKKNSFSIKYFLSKYIYIFIIGIVLLAGVSYGLTFFVNNEQIATGDISVPGVVGYISYNDKGKVTKKQALYQNIQNKVQYAPDDSKFLGWSTTNDGEVEYSLNNDVSFNANTTLYAVYDINVMDFFPTAIQNVKSTITEVNFISASQSDIDTRYNAASTKADVTYKVNNVPKGSVKAWVEGTKLYIGADGLIYLSKGYDETLDLGLFEGFSAVTKFNFSNVDTSYVTTMVKMFCGCSSITSLNLSSFNTSNTTNMSIMFRDCTGLTSLNLSSFDTSNTTAIRHMFNNCSGITSLNLSSFNTSNVTDMGYLFYNCSALTSINVTNFDTSKVTTMEAMFDRCSGLTTLNVTNFNTSNVTNMYCMFYGCSGLTTLDVTNFNTLNVATMRSMFYGCSGLTSLNVTNFDTTNVTAMHGMFYNCSSLTSLNVTNFDTTNVTTMRTMFYGCTGLTSITGLSSFNTSAVTDMYAMFYGCSTLTKLDVSSFKTSNVTDMYCMFRGCSSLTTIYANDSFSTASINHSIAKTDGSTYNGGNNMFYLCSALVGGNRTAYSSSNVHYTYAKIDKAGQPGYFTYKGVIPSEYQNVLYIAGTGTQFINTEYYPTPNTGVEASFQFTDLTLQQRVFGAAGDLIYAFYINSSTKFSYKLDDDGSGAWHNTGIAVDKNKHSIIFNKSNSKILIDNSYDDSIISVTTVSQGSGTLHLMRASATGSVISQMRIYYFKIYENGVLVRNYVPCYRISDGVIGLYETVTGTFVTNAGEGTFTKGGKI